MERNSGQQLELFSGENNQTAGALRRSSAPFYARIRGYEKTLLTAIALFLTAIVSFSLGVERGRRSAISAGAATALGTEAFGRKVPQATPAVSAERQEPLPETTAGNVITKKTGIQQGGAFAIQLASYKTKSYAEKEAGSLRKRGLAPIILTKGNYSVLYVGGFNNKESAQSILTQLEKRYAGCRIRRL